MRPFKVADEVFWVGALDPLVRTFDVIMKAEEGTTYNSFLVRGSHKTALIDTVKEKFIPEFISNLAEFGGPGNIDYIVLNHTEPDHSGALGELIDRMPGAQVIISQKAEIFLRHLLNREVNIRLVGDGDTIDLGGERLRFVSAPFLHWPDTMFTYLERTRVLFTCDFLGSHYCDDRFFNNLVNDFSRSFRYYFQSIIRPSKKYVLDAVSKLEELDIEIIAPGHGPILRKDARKYIEMYREWSRVERAFEKLLLIFYVSIYGNTARMAAEIAKGVREEGVAARIFDVTETKPEDVLDEIEKADGVVVGSPTINHDAVKPIWDLLSSLATINVSGKVGASFGSYAWSGQAPKLIEERLRGLRFKIPEPFVRAQFVPTESDIKACREFGSRLAKSLASEIKSVEEVKMDRAE